MEEEWGSCGPVRFANPTMMDEEGNPVLCSCGKPAAGAMIGKEAYQVWCSDCSPLDKTEAEFVFRPVDDR